MAVKEPYQQSSHFEALGQILLTNQRLDKLAACHVNVSAHNMLEGPCLAPGVIPIFIRVLPLPSPPLPQDPDNNAVDEPRVLVSISLARTQGKSTILLIYINAHVLL